MPPNPHEFVRGPWQQISNQMVRAIRIWCACAAPDCAHFVHQHSAHLMATAAERQALAFLAGVALLGGGARIVLQRSNDNGQPPSIAAAAESVDGQLSAVDSARSSKRAKKRTGGARGGAGSKASPKRSASNENENAFQVIVDVDVATAEELEQLPRVGPALAARIVANRDSLGPFGSMAALGEVRGIGPAMSKLLSPMVTFSARPRQPAPRKR